MSDSATHDAHAHPQEKQYWAIFVVLFVLTAVEVAWSYLGFEGVSLVVPLLVMMFVKFILVAGGFMHLYYDAKLLNGKLFSWTFAAGLILTLLVFLAVFAAFEFPS